MMKRVIQKSFSVILAVTMLLSAMVFAVPCSAASFPNNLYNGNTAVTYTPATAAQGKYLIEVDAVKYSPNTSTDPQQIKSEAGDIIVTYKPNNGNAPEVTERYKNVIAANTFDTIGKGQFAYYIVLDGFPKSVTISLKKTNVSENDSGCYAGLKIWNADLGMFTSVYDFSDIQMSNGVDTSDLIFSSIVVAENYYPFAKEGDASITNLTLPSGQTATSAKQTFSVADQWGVTMIAPKFVYPAAAGLTFSQDKNVMTIKGTGDANIADASRTITLKATYDSMNPTVTSAFTLSKNITIYSASNRTYAPTYANRDKAGISVSFKAGSSEVEQFVLNASHQMTTTNYVVLKNNASREATVVLSSNASDKYSFQDPNFTLAPGATKSVQLIDNKTASTDYYADVKVDYTLEGLYDAATGMLANLNTGATIPFVYSNYGFVPTARIYQKGGFMYSEIDVQVDLRCNTGACLFVQNNFNLENDPDEYRWDVDCYINRDNYSTYEQTGMKFFFTNNYKHEYYFQDQDNYLGPYYMSGSYDSCGTFGMKDSPGNWSAESHKDKCSVKLDKGAGNTNEQAFHGTLFTGSNTSPQPAVLYFEKMQIHAWGSGSAYFTLPLNIYAYSKSGLRSQVASCKQKSLLSCYFNQTKWSEYCSMDSSALRTAQAQLGLDKTSQYNVTLASTNLNSAYSALISSTSGGSYSLIQNKHTGDIDSPIAQTSVDFYVFSYGATNLLRLNGTFSNACNKHSAAYSPAMNSKGTFEHTYHYWNIDFTSLNDVLGEYEGINKPGQFTNVDDSIGGALLAATSVDTSAASDMPQKQDDVENIANNLRNSMRNLRYTSYTMSVTHKMLSPTGSEEINNDTIQTYTEYYNKTATYGEYIDGTADLDNGTYTVKNRHYAPTADPTFLLYAADSYLTGISSEYICQENKSITFVYLSKEIQDNTLDTVLEQTLSEGTSGVWEDSYTKSSLAAFEEWFNEKYDDGTLTRTFSIFEQDAYDALLAEFQSEIDKLDPVISDEEITELRTVINNYNFLHDFSKAICHGNKMLEDFEPAYEEARQILSKVDEQDAGSHEAQQVLDTFDTFVLEEHQHERSKIARTPEDGVDGSYYVTCSDCNEVIDVLAYPCPHFNQFTQRGYDYNKRGASLRMNDIDVGSNIQDMRFTASCFIPENAVVKDFGYLLAQTKSLNNEAEPTNNTAVNVNRFVEGATGVIKKSLFNGNYSVHEAQDGQVYTFNIVIKVERDNWNTHYAARSYIVYEVDGMEVTVYDMSYSSRSVMYIASQAFADKNESTFYKNILAQKFGLGS